MLGDSHTNQLLSIKRITLNKRAMDVTLEFEAAVAGKQTLVLYLMCDSYMGCDQEHEIRLQVAAAREKVEVDEEPEEDANAMKQ